jgi:DNA-binding response OmpR family regulator
MAHILLVEPDNILGRTYAAALEAAGHSVAYGRHAQNAVHLADQKSPDLIILELQTPGHNGIEFLYEFRSYPEWQHVPVIIHTLVTPQDLEAHASRFEHLGITGYLYKPTTNLRQLISSVNETLDKERVAVRKTQA